MSIYNRFFGKFEDDDNPETDLLAQDDPDEEHIALQVLLAEPLAIDADALAQSLRNLHSETAEARCEIGDRVEEKGGLLGLVGWGDHVVKMVGFDNPMPIEPVRQCVEPAHYGPELKEQAQVHRSHVLLWYAGSSESTLERYVTLAVVAGVLTRFGAFLVLNEAARTSFPTEGLCDKRLSEDVLQMLRSFPLPVLYCGFVKYNVEGIDGVWMRTYGAHLFGLPDLAMLVSGHDQGQFTFDLFGNIWSYLQNTNALLEAGHTSQVGANTFLRFRDPREKEYFLESKGDILVAEFIDPDQVNS